jgi:transglutaminase-like putative cysteine protease
LPAAYRPVDINLTAARVVPDSLTLLVDSKNDLQHLVYDVDSAIPNPTQDQLRFARPSNPRTMARNLELPSNFPRRVRTLAAQVTRNAHSPYERALALQAFFRGGAFKYTLDTNLGDSADAITKFLLETRAGFCEQFAASFAAMARSVGLPSRVAVGYQPGTLGQDGLYHVTNRNAHAWPEVWIEGSGWIPFEPTPAFTEPTLGLGTGGPKQATPNTRPGGVTTTTGTPSSSLVPPTISRQPPPVSVTAPPVSKPQPHGLRNAFAIVALVVLVLALAVLVVFGAVSFVQWRRRWRRRRDHDPRRRVLGAWAEALDQLRVAGVPPRPSATSLEFALRYAPAYGAGDAGPALMELARLQSAALYAREEPSEDEASEAWTQVDTIRQAIRRNVARTRRWRNLLRRPSQ